MAELRKSPQTGETFFWDEGMSDWEPVQARQNPETGETFVLRSGAQEWTSLGQRPARGPGGANLPSPMEPSPGSQPTPQMPPQPDADLRSRVQMLAEALQGGPQAPAIPATPSAPGGPAIGVSPYIGGRRDAPAPTPPALPDVPGGLPRPPSGAPRMDDPASVLAAALGPANLATIPQPGAQQRQSGPMQGPPVPSE
ncbi:MAG: hypothetical protein ACLFTP_09950, partial [Rhodosalinus sp.]